MTAIHFQHSKEIKSRKFFAVSETDSTVRLRLQIHNLQQEQREPIISNLVFQHGLTVDILRKMSISHSEWHDWLDVELIGTVQQIQHGLVYLESLNLSLKGKPNVDGDSWHC